MKKIINIGLAAFMLFAIGACGKDGSIKSIKIGEQVWMAKNLNDPSKGGKCYEYKSENCEKYGRLYNWDEAMKACPEGWHLPSDEEWQTLVDFIGGEVAGTKLKAKDGWNDYWDGYENRSGNGTDDYGFSALPGGDGSGGSFSDVGSGGRWWTSTEYTATSAYRRYMYGQNSGVGTSFGSKPDLAPVRCLQGSAPKPFKIVEFNGKKIPITIFYSPVADNGFNLDSLMFEYDNKAQTIHLNYFSDYISTPSVSDYNFDGYMDISVFSKSDGVARSWYNIFIYKPQTKSYYLHEELSKMSDVSADAETQTVEAGFHASGECDLNGYKWINGELTLIYNENNISDGHWLKTRTLQDGKWVEKKERIIDDDEGSGWCLGIASIAKELPKTEDPKEHKSVKIGHQTWMSENLNDPSKGGKCYDNKESNCAKYGRLYEWEEAIYACPKGWHLPSNEEWQTLVDFAGGKEVAGKKLKAKSGWNNYYDENGNGTDEYGFSSLPGGGGGSDGSFSDVGSGGFWWSATEYIRTSALRLEMTYDYRGFYVENTGDYDKSDLYSVRCIKD